MRTWRETSREVRTSRDVDDDNAWFAALQESRSDHPTRSRSLRASQDNDVCLRGYIVQL